jgi:hypothetical protein
MNRCTGSYGLVQADRPNMSPTAIRRAVIRGFIAPFSQRLLCNPCQQITVCDAVSVCHFWNLSGQGYRLTLKIGLTTASRRMLFYRCGHLKPRLRTSNRREDTRHDLYHCHEFVKAIAELLLIKHGPAIRRRSRAVIKGDTDRRSVDLIDEASRILRRAKLLGPQDRTGRAGEAWQTLEATEHRRRNSAWDWPDFEWEDARIDVLEALGRADDAQAARWGCFERALSSPHLRAYLKQLPDFEDVDAERRALDYAQRSGNLLHALSFLVSWPAPDRAASLVLQRFDELDGDNYEILTPAAEALAGKNPLAATLALRSMIDFALRNSRSSRYRHAARRLLDCSSLSSEIEDFVRFEPHDAYKGKLRREHGRKSSFWSLID